MANKPSKAARASSRAARENAGLQGAAIAAAPANPEVGANPAGIGPNQAPEGGANVLGIAIPTETPAAILNSRSFTQQDKDNYVRDFAETASTFSRLYQNRVAEGDAPGEARRRALTLTEQNASIAGGPSIGERQALGRLREAASAAGLGRVNTPLQQRRTEVGARQAEAQREARRAAFEEAAARRAARANRREDRRRVAEQARGNQ